MSALVELFIHINTLLMNGSSLLNCVDTLATYGDIYTDPNDWKRYVKFDQKTYIRIPIPELSNELFEIILICWDKNQKSPIHNHPENGCILKVLQGELTEDIYIKSDTGKYVYNSTKVNVNGNVSYMCGNDIIHRISNTNSNMDEDFKTISLHIYSPPKFKYTLIKEIDTLPKAYL